MELQDAFNKVRDFVLGIKVQTKIGCKDMERKQISKWLTEAKNIMMDFEKFRLFNEKQCDNIRSLIREARY